ncbi:hypothetical protein N780_08770 [Pontibacillus chungwhensis BH030062]|uniref:Uncharacterized protein n=1 Tax=Pontibacillus chungwhensis BH030062 TaxID=1385513 RepID=A0A0A2UTX0_9BACI|nr:hypothetical protein [Pontibacillus chungwhensis]KGP91334.1 hypothetical protein N780_08770 [Pontibacillus chungwhensis BH030062]
MNPKLYQLIVSTLSFISLYCLIIERSVLLFVTVIVIYVIFELVLYLLGVKQKVNEKKRIKHQKS